jgi:hypothetical protein
MKSSEKGEKGKSLLALRTTGNELATRGALAEAANLLGDGTGSPVIDRRYNRTSRVEARR